MSGLTWSPAEKKIARRAFDAAVHAALAEIMAEFKDKAAAVATPADMWDLEDYLRTRRRAFNEMFDYRYSQLLRVFAQLACAGYLDETQLVGLSADKLEAIRISSLLRRD